MKPSPDILPDAIQALVQRAAEEVRPMRVILFGSHARGGARADSDVDLLVVMPEGTVPRRTMRQLYRMRRPVPLSVDFLVTTPSVLERHRDNPGLIYREILKTGREVYAAS